MTSVTAACVLLLAASGCSKQEDAAGTSPTGAVQKATATALGQTQVIEAPAGAQAGKVQSLIDQARKLLGENKWSEALASLKQLSGQSLTPEQQSLVQSLTAQAEKAGEAAAKAAQEAAKSAGDLLPKK